MILRYLNNDLNHLGLGILDYVYIYCAIRVLDIFP